MLQSRCPPLIDRSADGSQLSADEIELHVIVTDRPNEHSRLEPAEVHGDD